MIGFPYAHYCKIYRDKFKEGALRWLDEFKVYNRLQVIKLAIKLNWRLPAELIPDEAVDIRIDKRQTP